MLVDLNESCKLENSNTRIFQLQKFCITQTRVHCKVLVSVFSIGCTEFVKIMHAVSLVFIFYHIHCCANSKNFHEFKNCTITIICKTAVNYEFLIEGDR